MNNLYIDTALERDKNVKAGVYTGVVCTVLLILFFFAQWTLPTIPAPPLNEGIEVNLGNSDEGLGDIAPQVPGEPTNDDQETYSPPATSQPVAQQEQPIQGDENEADDVPTVNSTPKPVVKNTAPPRNVPPAVKPRPATQPVSVTPTPVPPKAKAVYKGGTANGTGGNGADSYNGVRNQGVVGGNGDQGKPNGNPNSDSYQGNGGSGKSGVSIRSGLGGRRFSRLPAFEDEFNQPAKVAVNIKVAANGSVTSATINLQGTTTTNANIRSIAIRKALQLKLNAAAADEQVGVIVFDFRLKG